MSGKLKLIFILTATVWAVPALGQTGPSPTDKTVVVLGQTLHYWDAGSGPVLVLVHGLGSAKENDWGRVFMALSEEYRVIASRWEAGFPGSSPWKPEATKRWVSVEKLVLVDAAGLKRDQPIPDLNPSTLAAERKLLPVVFYDSSWVTGDLVKHGLAERISANISSTVRSILSSPSSPALAEERLDGRLGGIHVPTLVVWEKQDELLPIASGERYSKEIAGAKFVSFDKCGHVPPMEKSAEFVGAVEDFLK